jgi:chemotaxis methyl-accepting protein methylase
VHGSDALSGPDRTDDCAQDEAQFADLTAKISRERGFRCGSYKEKCLRRRIAVRMRAKGVHNFDDYARALDDDPGEYDRLLDALTINVTKFFRNWDTYASLERNVIPALWALPDSPLRIWSAGCASGEEPYSLAIMFHRYASSRAEGPLALRRVRVSGSDIDKRSLESARKGEYSEAAFADTPLDLRARYFQDGPPISVIPLVKEMVAFEQRDLLREPPPRGGHHLITCRNVIIYFDRESQEALFERFYHALLPGGFLMLGKVETLLGHARTLFAPVDGRERIFRRI